MGDRPEGIHQSHRLLRLVPRWRRQRPLPRSGHSHARTQQGPPGNESPAAPLPRQARLRHRPTPRDRLRDQERAQLDFLSLVGPYVLPAPRPVDLLLLAACVTPR